MTTKSNIHIQDSEGQRKTEYSDSCPKCMTTKVTKETGTEADFDEHGWFYPVTFQCQSAKCGHKWRETFRVTQ